MNQMNQMNQMNRVNQMNHYYQVSEVTNQLNLSYSLNSLFLGHFWSFFYLINYPWARGRAVKSAVHVIHVVIWICNPKVVSSNPTRGTLGKVSENQFLGSTQAM